MIKKKLLLKDIVSFLGEKVIAVYGNIGNTIIDNITNSERVDQYSLDWVGKGKSDKQNIVENSPAKSILVDESIEYSDAILRQGKVLIVVDNPKLALSDVIKEFFQERITLGIDKTAYIDPEAIIGKNVYIGPHCYIGKCVIGDGNVIHSGVHIYNRSIVGNNNVIHSGSVICVDGLGCMRQLDGHLEEFPQIGGVKIGNNCYIGANCHIASGSLSDTIIENGCKINGMCFIGSNDVLHENVWITGSTMLAGSVEVGANSTIFSRVIVRDWCKIGERVTIGMGSVVTKNVPDGEMWFGSPAHKMEKK